MVPGFSKDIEDRSSYSTKIKEQTKKLVIYNSKQSTVLNLQIRLTKPASCASQGIAPYNFSITKAVIVPLPQLGRKSNQLPAHF